VELNVTFQPDEVGVVINLLCKLAGTPTAAVSHTDADDSGASKHPAVFLLESMEEGSLSELFFHVLSEERRTFGELAELMYKESRRPGKDRTREKWRAKLNELYGAKPPDAAAVRAIYRNVRRREQGLAGAGAISAPIVQQELSRGTRRYFLAPDAYAAIHKFHDGE
jgi:Spy/CpxP family protein refolding chaperone